MITEIQTKNQTHRHTETHTCTYKNKMKKGGVKRKDMGFGPPKQEEKVVSRPTKNEEKTHTKEGRAKKKRKREKRERKEERGQDPDVGKERSKRDK